jgi:ubiquinone/menaquinone biosynthesis C-methylase UbiE
MTSAWNLVMARLYDPVLALGERRGMAERRAALLAGARGRVLEIGAGTGLNLAAYPGDLDELVLTEPDPAMLRRLRRRVSRSGRPARVVRAGAGALPFAGGGFDTVVSTMVLCTVDDPEATVRELRRVLRPGGALLFIEHIRADAPALARRQDRLARPWRAFAAGCRCNRPTRDVLAGAFADVRTEPGTWTGMPSVVHPLAVGHAR